MGGLESIEKGGYILMFVVVVGVILVILVGVTYNNYNTNRNQYLSQLQSTTGCQITNSLASNTYCYNLGQWTNYTTSTGNIAQTGGTNANYVYYILFAALIIGVVIGVLVGVAKSKS